MIALRPFTYATRRLSAGDIFQARKPLDARLLVAVKKAKPYRHVGKIAPPPPELLKQLDHDHDGHPGGSASPPATDDLSDLRKEYTDKLGKRPFNGWGADTLREKIAAAS